MGYKISALTAAGSAPQTTDLFEISRANAPYDSKSITWANIQSAFTTGFSTSGAAITNNVLTGKSGGQTFYGDTASGGNLTISSTAHATKGFIYFGSSTKMSFDETNGRLGVGIASPTATVHSFGAGSTSSTFAGKFENSSATNLLSIRNDGLVTWGTKMIWNNSNLTLSIDGSGASSDTLQVTSTISNTSVFSNFGNNNLKASVYARTENATPVTPLWSVWEQPSNSSYISLLKLFNRAGTGIGVGAGAGIDYSASNSGGANPVNYAQHGMITTNKTASSEAGYLFWKVATAGALVENMRLYPTGIILGAVTTISSCALFEMISTTQGLRLPNMTTAQKNAIGSPLAGLKVFDTTLSKECVYSGAGWETVTSI